MNEEQIKHMVDFARNSWPAITKALTLAAQLAEYPVPGDRDYALAVELRTVLAEMEGR